MSMNLSVYVGPYLRVTDCSREIIEKHESVVCCGRGELFTNDADDVMYLIPSRKLNGVTRQMIFSRDTEMPVIEIDDIDMLKEIDSFIGEAESFIGEAESFIGEAESAGAEVIIHWGVVCCYV